MIKAIGGTRLFFHVTLNFRIFWSERNYQKWVWQEKRKETKKSIYLPQYIADWNEFVFTGNYNTYLDSALTNIKIVMLSSPMGSPPSPIKATFYLSNCRNMVMVHICRPLSYSFWKSTHLICHKTAISAQRFLTAFISLWSLWNS